MSTDINTALACWIEDRDVRTSVEAEQEIANRMVEYPPVRAVLTAPTLDMMRLEAAIEKCTIVTDMLNWASTQFHELLANTPEAQVRIDHMIRAVPPDAEGIAQRIDEFIDDSTQATGLQRSYAATLASLLLTTAYPDRFVDYSTRKQWDDFARALDYGLPATEESHGEWIVWASELAGEIARTSAFKEHWPRRMARYQEPLWVVAGLCRANKRMEDSRETSEKNGG